MNNKSKVVHLELILGLEKILIQNYDSLQWDAQKAIEREYQQKLTISIKSTADRYFFYESKTEIIDFYNLVKEYASEQLEIKLDICENIQNLIDKQKKLKDSRLKKIDIIQKIKDGNKDSWIKKKINEIKTTIGPLLNIKPREVQYENIYHHILLDSACNFSVPGSGKSLIALGTYLYWKKLQKINKILVIAPIGSFISWEDEYKKIIKGADKSKIAKLEHSQENSRHLLNADTAEIYLINYEKLNKFEKLLKNTLTEENPFFIILDEAHRIKNPGAKKTVAIKKILNFCQYKLVLTGTPMPQSFADLKIYFDLIKKNYEEDLLPSYQELKNPREAESLIEKKLKKIQPYYSRITKTELGLPEPVITEWNDFQIDEKHWQIYEMLEQRIFRDLVQETDPEIARKLFKGRIFRMMQIIVDPRIIDFFRKVKKEVNNDKKYNEINKNDLPFEELETEETRKNFENYCGETWKKIINYDKVPTRYTFCFDKVNELFSKKSIKKIIIWSSWIFVIKELQKIFNEKYHTKVIYGAIEIDQREKIIHDFQKENGEIEVLICNPASVSESVSLHQHCDDAVYFDITWNAIHYLQSKDRIHRIGKVPPDRLVTYHLISYKDSIDTKIWDNIFTKEKRMIKALEENTLGKNLTDKENIIDYAFDILWDKKEKNKI